MLPFFPKYREIEHTADLRLEIRALTWPALLQHAAEAFTHAMTDVTQVQRCEEHRIDVQADSREELFHACLQKIHLFYELEGFLTRSLQPISCQPQRLQARLWGETFDAERHVLKTEIKAVTYHQLEVTHSWCGWRARVIFDI